MTNTLSTTVLLIIALAPLLGSIVAGLFGRQVGRQGAHTVTIAGVLVSCLPSLHVLYRLAWGDTDPYNQNLYAFFEVGGYSAHVGFMVDRLTAMMIEHNVGVGIAAKCEVKKIDKDYFEDE